MSDNDISLGPLVRDDPFSLDVAFVPDEGIVPLSAPDAPFGEGGLGGPLLDLPAAPASRDPVLAQLETWLDAILVERAARDTRE